MRVAGRLANEGVAPFEGGKNQCRPPQGAKEMPSGRQVTTTCCCTWTRIFGWLDYSFFFFFLLLSFLSRTSLVGCGVVSLPAWPMGNFGQGRAALGDLFPELASSPSSLFGTLLFFLFFSNVKFHNGWSGVCVWWCAFVFVVQDESCSGFVFWFGH